MDFRGCSEISGLKCHWPPWASAAASEPCLGEGGELDSWGWREKGEVHASPAGCRNAAGLVRMVRLQCPWGGVGRSGARVLSPRAPASEPAAAWPGFPLPVRMEISLLSTHVSHGGLARTWLTGYLVPFSAACLTASLMESESGEGVQCHLFYGSP